MGFGFNLFVLPIVLVGTLAALIYWLFHQEAAVGKTIGFVWLALLGFILLISGINWLTSKKKLDKADYVGEYVINRAYFKGEQTDWQYNHFWFEIKENDSIYFYVMEQEKIVETYKGTIETTAAKRHPSARLIIKMDTPTHHIMCANPTTYRSAWSFYLVFNSPKFHNVFFVKQKREHK